jgi:hypothetical protein
MANKNTKSIEIREAALFSVNDERFDITASVAAFFYYENIFTPFVSAAMNMVDSGSNLIGTLPIQGGERVTIRIKDSSDEEFEYELYVWKVYNRQFSKSAQTYNLALISKEALYNEGVRITEILKGTPDSVVEKILTEYLQTEKEINKKNCKYQVNFFPNGKKAHSIIQSLQHKSVPQSSSSPKGSTNKTTAGGKSGLSGDTQKTSGTAGYLFFENKDGFHFNPIDYYYSTGDDAFGGEAEVATYEVKPSKDGDRFIIEEYNFDNEIDLIEQMRSGTFSSHIVFYNFSTGQYEEYRHSLKESFDGMAHLGSQSKLGLIQETLSTNPARVMSMIVDHETWFSGDGPGSNEDRDNTGGQGSPFPDYQKHYIAQGIARRNYMINQKLEIQIPGNMNLKVGDKIKVMLPNMVAQKARETEKYDRENSGTYLISALSHNNAFLNSNTCTTKLELIRDTSGMKEYTSNVK